MDFAAAFIGVRGHELIEQLTIKGMPSDTAYGFLNNSMDSVVRGLQKLDIGKLMREDSDTQTSSLLDHIRVASLAHKSGISSELACRSLRTIIPCVFDFIKASEPRGPTRPRKRSGITDSLPPLTRFRPH